MITLVLGLVLLIIPFLLINKFQDKKRGFYVVLFGTLAFQFFLGFITQLFGIFSYTLILIINLVIASIILFKTDFKSLKSNIVKIKIDWMLVFVILVCAISLYSVHHDYTGKITTVTTSFKEVSHFSYPYPYFSDEWVGISLIKYSINSGKLPFADTLWYEMNFANISFGIHTFGSEIILLLGLDPLNDYIWLSFFSGLLICLLVYFILRENEIGRFSSAVSSILVIYITRGANLPGIWNFMPLIGGIILLLFSLLFVSLKNNKLAISSGVLSLIFYPPLAIFLIPLIFFYYFVYERKSVRYLIWFVVLTALSGILLVLLLRFFWGKPFDVLGSYLPEKFFYETFTKNAIPDFSIWKVVPVFALVFAIIGSIWRYKDKFWMIIPVLVGLTYWIIYSRVFWRFIIEYERVVVTTSILIFLISGFGLDYLVKILKKQEFIKKNHILIIVQIAVLVALFVMSFAYTQINSWEKLQLHTIDGKMLSPASPANAYLHEDDLLLFQNISKKRFLTIPWKGLVIAAATGNYPIESKSSTLTAMHYSYYKFMSLDCENKTSVSEDYQISYIYSEPFNCTGFSELGKSSEGLVLYKFEL